MTRIICRVNKIVNNLFNKIDDEIVDNFVWCYN